MSISATRRQMDLLRFIHGFLQAHGYAPYHREMQDALGMKSKSGINRMLGSLCERGLIRRIPYRDCSIEVLVPPSIPRAPDGQPLFAVPGFGEA